MSIGRVAIVFVVGVALAWLSTRFLQGLIERRFGLAAGSAWTAAVAAGLLPVVVAVRVLGWMRPIVDEGERRRVAERAIAQHRKVRRWWVLVLGLMLVESVGPVIGALAGGAWGWDGMVDPVLLGAFAFSIVPGVLPSPGEPLGEVDARDQVLRGEATRLGYVVLLGLGVTAAAVSGWRPAVGAQFWGPVLVAGLLVAQVRMMVPPGPAVPVAAGRGFASAPPGGIPPAGPGGSAPGLGLTRAFASAADRLRAGRRGRQGSASGADVAVQREIGEVSGRQVAVVVGAYFVIGALFCLVQGPIERRFGVPGWLTEVAIVVGGALLVTWATRRAGWGRPIRGEEARRMAAARSVVRDRGFRPWLILGCVLALLPSVASMLTVLDRLPPLARDWGDAALLLSMATSNAAHFLPARGEPLGEVDARDQADRGRATRVGFVVLLVLGVGAAALAERWPVAGAQCWAPVLLASVVAAQVWIMVLSWQPGAAVSAETG